MSCARVLTIPSDCADLKKPSTLMIMIVYSSNNRTELLIVLQNLILQINCVIITH